MRESADRGGGGMVVVRVSRRVLPRLIVVAMGEGVDGFEAVSGGEVDEGDVQSLSVWNVEYEDAETVTAAGKVGGGTGDEATPISDHVVSILATLDLRLHRLDCEQQKNAFNV